MIKGKSLFVSSSISVVVVVAFIVVVVVVSLLVIGICVVSSFFLRGKRGRKGKVKIERQKERVN